MHRLDPTSRRACLQDMTYYITLNTDIDALQINATSIKKEREKKNPTFAPNEEKVNQ